MTRALRASQVGCSAQCAGAGRLPSEALLACLCRVRQSGWPALHDDADCADDGWPSECGHCALSARPRETGAGQRSLKKARRQGCRESTQAWRSWATPSRLNGKLHPTHQMLEDSSPETACDIGMKTAAGWSRSGSGCKAACMRRPRWREPHQLSCLTSAIDAGLPAWRFQTEETLHRAGQVFARPYGTRLHDLIEIRAPSLGPQNHRRQTRLRSVDMQEALNLRRRRGDARSHLTPPEEDRSRALDAESAQ